MSLTLRLVAVIAAISVLSGCGLLRRTPPVEDIQPPASISPTVNFLPAAPVVQPVAPRQRAVNRATVAALVQFGPIGQYSVGPAYTIGGQRYIPQEQPSYSENGLSSWYGIGLEGNRTSNGEVFNPEAFTAAHRTLPFSSVVKVTNLDNGRAAVVRINDRGPFLQGHIIDVSQRAAQELGFGSTQGNRVRVELLVPETQEIARLTGGSFGTGFGANIDVPRVAAPLTTTPISRPVTVTPTSSPSSALPALDDLPTLPSTPTVRPIPGTNPLPAARPITPSGTSAPLPASNQPLPLPPTVTGSAGGLPPLPQGTVGAGPAPSAIQPGVATQNAITAPATAGSGFFVQAGSFTSQSNAEQLRNRLSRFGNAIIFPATVNGTQRFRVRLGPFSSRAQAQAQLGNVIGAGGSDAIIVRQ